LIEKLIFRKFLNIQKMAKLHQRRVNRPRLDDKDLDELFELYLRPLKSRNARTIYRIFLDEIERRELTTLDLQERLVPVGISLSKKEINAWLRSLQDAGLVSKEVMRGKPTTIEYDGRYSFDLWSLTPKGLDLGDLLEVILTKQEAGRKGLDDDAIILDVWDSERVEDAVEDMDERYILLASIRALWGSGRPLKSGELMNKINPTQTTLDETLLSANGRKLLAITESVSESVVDRILSYLGLRKKDRNFISLTPDGRRLAEKIWGDN
jgi:DNA-binding HxlR family transcriptional regulator